jgi:2-polyprenyl-3-methyl-5-hydroxy-6-metoxy-1,4-benzoquinol methylase
MQHAISEFPRADASVKCLAKFAAKHITGRSYEWAMDHYKNTLIALAREFSFVRLLEIGGGRSPLFSQSEIHALGLSYTVNDISEDELMAAPDWVNKVCFDVAGDCIPVGQYDLVFSRMVLEHVARADKVYANILKLLAPNGICLNFHPTLYATPFVINYLLPTHLSRQLLGIFGALVTDAKEHYPKFPARYHWCRSTIEIQEKIKKFGFDEVLIAPFWGHGYFHRIPLLSHLGSKIAIWAERRQRRLLTSYAYTFVRK